MFDIFIPLKELLFPNSCICCKIPLKDYSSRLCTQCLDSIELISNPICSICGLPFISKNQDDHICGNCILHPPLYSIKRSPFCYTAAVKDLIISFKYFYDFLSFSALIDVFNTLEFNLDILDSDVVIPVPLHPKRLRQRGFNQASLIAKRIFKNIPISFNALLRTRNTPHQMGLKRQERLKNVVGAFKVRKKDKIRSKTILLVDDVVTTGATINECCKELLNAGAKEVKVFSLAQTI